MAPELTDLECLAVATTAIIACAETMPLLTVPFDRCDMMADMKTISLAVSEAEYEVFRRAAQEENRPIAQLIREAMTYYREERLEAKSPLTDLPLLAGHRLLQELPTREELYDDVFSHRP